MATDKDAFGEDGLFTDEVMRQSVEDLLQYGVFESPQALLLKALTDYEVVIPDSLLGKYALKRKSLSGRE